MASIPPLGNAETKAAYRFWDNKKVDDNEIVAAGQLSTLDRMKDEEIILAIQDTTDLVVGGVNKPTVCGGRGDGGTGGKKRSGYLCRSVLVEWNVKNKVV